MDATGGIDKHRALYAQRMGSGISQKSREMINECCDQMTFKAINASEDHELVSLIYCQFPSLVDSLCNNKLIFLLLGKNKHRKRLKIQRRNDGSESRNGTPMSDITTPDTP